MGAEGGCRCGAVRYEVEGDPIHASLCHCTDCRRSAGAHAVGWMLFANDRVRIEGAATAYESSPGTIREFCGRCGTGLFYRNEGVFPNQVDVQLATLDDPDRFPPQACIQVADAPGWAASVGDLPKFERFPG